MKRLNGSRRWLRRMRTLGIVIGCVMNLAPSIAQHTPSQIASPQVAEGCMVEVVLASAGQPITLLFEPALQLSAGEQLIYETLSGDFLTTNPSLITWVPTRAGWDFIQVRAVSVSGNSRVVARIDFVVDDESLLSEVYNLPIDVRRRGYIVPLSAGGENHAAIWLEEINTQAPGRPGRGGKLCLKRPDPPPGLNCASLPPGGTWVCPPYYVAETLCTRLFTCSYRRNQVITRLCGEEAAELKAQLGLAEGCITIGEIEFCVTVDGCVQVTSTIDIRVQCQQCTEYKKQFCRRFCCRNNVVECCEQHLWQRKCFYRIVWLPSGPVKTPQVCTNPSGPYTQPGCDW